MRTLLLLLPVLAACGRRAEEIAVAATVSDTVSTVVSVSWSTTEESTGFVEYGPTEAYGYATPTDPAATEHTVALLGLTAETEVHYRLVADRGAGESVGSDQVIVTGSLPSSLPGLIVTSNDDALSPAFTLFPFYDPIGHSSTVFILNAAGSIVWYLQLDGIVFQTVRSADGRSVVVVDEQDDDALSTLDVVPLDGGEAVYLSAPGAHHDVISLPEDQGYAFIATLLRDVDGLEVAGDILNEVTPAGDITELWNAFDEMEVVENNGWAQSPADWTHANGVAYDVDQDLYLLSLYRQEVILGIERTSRETLWTLGATGDYTFVGDVGFAPQHAPEFTDGGLVLFDNAYQSPASRVVAYTLDETAMTATLDWSLSSPYGESVVVMGSGAALPGGGVMSTWGEACHVLTTNEAGAVVRDVSVDQVGVIGSFEAFSSFY